MFIMHKTLNSQTNFRKIILQVEITLVHFNLLQ